MWWHCTVQLIYNELLETMKIVLLYPTFVIQWNLLITNLYKTNYCLIQNKLLFPNYYIQLNLRLDITKFGYNKIISMVPSISLQVSFTVSSLKFVISNIHCSTTPMEVEFHCKTGWIISYSIVSLFSETQPIRRVIQSGFVNVKKWFFATVSVDKV